MVCVLAFIIIILLNVVNTLLSAGGTLRIYADSLKPNIPYKTILLSTRDTADFAVVEALEKYGLEKENPREYCIARVNIFSVTFIFQDLCLTLVYSHETFGSCSNKLFTFDNGTEDLSLTVWFKWTSGVFIYFGPVQFGPAIRPHHRASDGRKVQVTDENTHFSRLAD